MPLGFLNPFKFITETQSRSINGYFESLPLVLFDMKIMSCGYCIFNWVFTSLTLVIALHAHDDTQIFISLCRLFSFGRQADIYQNYWLRKLPLFVLQGEKRFWRRENWTRWTCTEQGEYLEYVVRAINFVCKKFFLLLPNFPVSPNVKEASISISKP